LFNYHKTAEGHRNVANQYTALVRKCSQHILKADDFKLNENSYWEEVSRFTEQYKKINQEAEPFATNSRDFKHALRQERNRLLTAKNQPLPKPWQIWK
jgi:hypothetical protein